jgi:hypothetical protein
MAQSPENPFNRLKQRFEEAARRMRSDFEPTDLAFDPNAERVSLELDFLSSQLTGFAVNNSVPRILQLRTQFGQELTTVRRLEDEQLRKIISPMPRIGKKVQAQDIRSSLPVDYVQDSSVIVMFEPNSFSLRCTNPETVNAFAAEAGTKLYDLVLGHWPLADIALRPDLFDPNEWEADRLEFMIAVRRGSAVYSKFYVLREGRGPGVVKMNLQKQRIVGSENIEINKYIFVPEVLVLPETELLIKHSRLHILQEGTTGKEKARLGKKETLPVGS